MAAKKCPVCGVSVKVENLDRHLKNQHPHAEVDAAALLTSEEKEEVQEAKAAARPTLTASGKRTIMIVAVAVAVILVIAFLLTNLRSTGPGIGQTAPDFTLQLAGGGSATLSQYRGTPLLLEFMNTHCPNCQAEAPTLSVLYGAYGSRVHFLSVDMYLSPSEPSATSSELLSWKTTYNTPWDYAMDNNNNVANTYAVKGTPTTYIIDGGGVVRNYFYGAYPYSSFSNALNVTLG